MRLSHHRRPAKLLGSAVARSTQTFDALMTGEGSDVQTIRHRGHANHPYGVGCADQLRSTTAG
jgi:hypothetical protein